MRRAAAPGWPHILLPAPGCYPPAAAPPRLHTERILHLSLYPHEPHARLSLDTIAGCYRMVYWRGKDQGELVAEAVAAAQAIRPTLVFMQLQVPGVLEPEHIEIIRGHCAPEVVIVNWDGDQHYEPRSKEREWFVRLGRVCDTSLVVNTEHPEDYTDCGVRHPGYLQIGIDPTVFHPVPPAQGVPNIVLLANGGHPVHRVRTQFVHELAACFGPERFGVYGAGWDRSRIQAARPALGLHHEAPVYAAAEVALSLSARNDLPRYTSDRLLRLLASGGVPVVEEFPDSEGLGLVGGWNCLLWHGWPELAACLQTALEMGQDERQAMRDAAVMQSRDHAWPARMLELLAIVEAVRADR